MSGAVVAGICVSISLGLYWLIRNQVPPGWALLLKGVIAIPLVVAMHGWLSLTLGIPLDQLDKVIEGGKGFRGCLIWLVVIVSVLVFVGLVGIAADFIGLLD